MIGTIISKYKVETLLNKGINCEIYSGINTETRQKVTIHRINRQLILANVEIKLKIKNDLYTLSQISNPAIEAIYEYVTYEDDLVYISEFVEGVPLNKYLDKTASDKFARLSVLENKFLPKILQGLSAVHSKGICHGHLRPSNILITRNEDVKIINWGLAELSELDKISKNVGVIEYLSPEQIQKRPVDIRSDVYSLGVTLFELITGKKPYSGLASDAEISSKINDESFLLTMGEDENLPEKYAAVIKKATEKFPENRISVGQIISELSTVNVSPNIPEKPNPVPVYQQPPVNVVKQTYTRPPTPKP